MKYILACALGLVCLGCAGPAHERPYQYGTVYIHEQFVPIVCQATEPCREGETEGPLSCKLVK